MFVVAFLLLSVLLSLFGWIGAWEVPILIVVSAAVGLAVVRRGAKPEGAA